MHYPFTQTNTTTDSAVIVVTVSAKLIRHSFQLHIYFVNVFFFAQLLALKQF